MALTGDTGNGATLTFAASMGWGTNTTSLQCISITQGAQTVASIDVSTLATSDAMESIPSDLRDLAENTASFKFLTEPGANDAGGECDLPAAAGSITLTYPMRSGETQAASITATGFITSFTPPALQNGELQVGEIAWKWDGDTGPDLTAAS